MSKTETIVHGGSTALTEAYGKVTERVTSAYAAARDTASDAAHSTVSGIESNPVAAVVGGLLIGAVAGALIPRGPREKQLLEPISARIGEAARAALDAGKSAGVSSFVDAGLGTDNLRAQAAKLVEQALGAASAAGVAAMAAARDTAKR